MHTRIVRLLGVLGIAAFVAAGCGMFERMGAPPPGTEGSAVSSVEPRRTEFASKAQPVPLRAAVASRGGCEPRYGNDRTGTCIDNKPCRGFGVLENGRAVCMCFATRGGCAEGQRCDTRGAQCVRDDMAEFNRAR